MSDNENCKICKNKKLNSWDKKISKTLGYKNPVCEKCISLEYGVSVDNLRTRMEDFFGIRPCQGI